MNISWLGHAAFLLKTSKNTTIITDPYEPNSYSGAIKYAPINVKADIVTVSHQHFDHNYTVNFKDAYIIDKVGNYKFLDVECEGILSYHDESGGSKRGENIIFIIKADGLKIVHFGDLGTENLDYSKFKDVDIVFIPVGGTFTIDAKGAINILEKIKPKIAIPMHFKTSKILFDIDPVSVFLKYKKDFEEKDFIEVNPSNINSFKNIVVLKHLR